jgi:alpha-glucosidase
LALPLSFLGPGRYTARIWKDAADAQSDPNHLTAEKLPLTPNDTLKLHLALDGGFVAQLAPAGD